MSLKSDIISCMVVTWLAALLALIARIFARRMTKVAWWYDDYLCVGAFVSDPFDLCRSLLLTCCRSLALGTML
jgi:hypothetical protein